MDIEKALNLMSEARAFVYSLRDFCKKVSFFHFIFMLVGYSADTK